MTMLPYEVPLSPTPQIFEIQLGDVTYKMRVSWNDASQGGWILDIFDVNEVPIICGIPFVTGVNLLGQYDYLGFKGQLFVQTDYDLYAVPTFTNLGIQARLYYLTDQGTA